jgi:hypothetical protein
MQPEGLCGARRARTVWLPGVLTLALWAVFWSTPFIVIIAFIVILIVAVGLSIPEWRSAIAAILWVLFALSCVCVPVLLLAIAQAIRSFQ